MFLVGLIRAPLSLLLVVLKNFNSLLKNRVDFERKNLLEDECRSFKKDHLIADYCFEVSSEGELEQVRPLIEIFLKEKKRIEILFASPSVESKCVKLARENRELIRILRLPLVSFFPVNFLFFQSLWQWVSAPKILLCRYDFYPEILTFKWFGKKLILLSAASKKHSWFKQESYSLFDIIVAANKSEEKFFKKMFPLKKVFSFDFRIPRIFERIALANDTLDKKYEIRDYLIFLGSKSNEEKIIIGSAWGSDFEILKNKDLEKDLSNGKLHLLIVPHSLSAASIKFLIEQLKSQFPQIPVYEISALSDFKTELLIKYPGIVLLGTPGILCELYTQFSFAYVGGGYERSIHSVLEPYLSGSVVFFGPKVHRSTEYDFIKDLSPQEIHLLKNPESFYNLFKEHAKKTSDQTIRNALKENYLAQMESIVNEIELC